MDVEMDTRGFRGSLTSDGARTPTAGGSSSGTSSSHAGLSKAAYDEKFRVYDAALMHAATCQNKHCVANDGRCHKIKASIDHFVRCYGPRRKESAIESCPNCSRIWSLLCYHAKRCATPSGLHCVVAQCDYLRDKIALKMQNDQAELQRAQGVLQKQPSLRENWPLARRVAQVEADRLQVLQMIAQIRADKERQKATVAQ